MCEFMVRKQIHITEVRPITECALWCYEPQSRPALINVLMYD